MATSPRLPLRSLRRARPLAGALLLWVLAVPVSAQDVPDAAAEDAGRLEQEQALREKAAREAEAKALEEEIAGLSEVLKAFATEAQEFREDVRGVVRRRFEEEREALGSQFESSIVDLEQTERQERAEAIALFERFLARYPDDARHTPDAMIRLAELYYEQTVDARNQALAALQERGEGDDATPEAIASFEKSIGLYQQVITRFPEYRMIDTIYNLLGYCLQEQGEPEEARDTFRMLVERFPQSRHVAEAWMRIGEYYFENPGANANESLREAVAAFKRALEFPDDPRFDKNLYKLGWTYYRLDDFASAVDAFVRLVDFYEGKGADDAGGRDMREEALQYTAVSFADEKWGGVGRLAEYFRRIGGRRWEYEVYRRLADALYDSTRYREAIEAYRLVLARNPLDKGAPQTHDRIVQAYARDQDRDRAFAERTRLVDAYSEGSAWAQANRDDPDVLRAARELVERSLVASAQYFHAQALELERAAADASLPPEQRTQKAALALRAFQQAAEAYGGYLQRFPHSKQLYEVMYYHAETLYNALQFLPAAKAYARVRDSSVDPKIIAHAAYSTVLAFQREIERQERQGLLARREPCTVERCRGLKLEAVPLPELRLALIEAADTYLARVPEAEDAPLLAYKAAQTYFAHFQFDEALRRYEEVIARHKGHEVAVFAYEDLLNRWLLAEDWETLEKVAGRMLAEADALRLDAAKIEEKRLVKYFARFSRADREMKAEKWDEASALYLSIVDDTEREAAKWGKWVNADKALFNAATCFVAARRFDSAMRTYERLFSDYPKSPLAQSALFEVAFNAEKSFDFGKAIDRYMLLVDNYPQAKERSAALYNAAKLLEALQRYPESARAYQRYAETFPNEADAAAQAFKAALIYERTRDYARMIKGLQDFIRQFGRVSEEGEKVVQAHLKIGHAQRELKKPDAALRAFQDCVAEYDRRRMTPDKYVAAAAAAEARFWIAEQQFEEFSALRFDPKGKGKKLAQSMTEQLEKLAGSLESVKRSYTEVIVKYKWPEWNTAALYRLGFADERFSSRLLDSPCPGEVRSLGGEEACIEYRIQLEELMAPINERAVQAYETAAERAAEARIVNDWTKLTMEKVCQYTPMKCRSLKEPRAQLMASALSPNPLALTADGALSLRVVPAVAPQSARPAAVPAVAAPAAPAAPAAAPPAEEIGSPAGIRVAPPAPAPAGVPPPVSAPVAPVSAPLPAAGGAR